MAAQPERGSARTRRRYDRIAPWYDRLERWLERRYYAAWRRRLWQQVRGGRVLEIGVGTGKNLPYHPRDAQVVAVDLSGRMLDRARRRARRLGQPVALAQMDGQHLAFAEHTFDTVVGAFVIGSLPDPVAGLREVRRVARPGGGVLLLEYVHPAGPLAVLADLLNPLARWVYGANINRRTLDHLRQAGLTPLRLERRWGGMIALITARP